MYQTEIQDIKIESMHTDILKTTIDLGHQTEQFLDDSNTTTLRTTGVLKEQKATQKYMSRGK